MAGVDGRARRGRVVLFPLPLQGDLTPMLQLADVLHRRGLAATILHATFNAPNPAAHPELTFVAVPLAVRERGPGMAMILSVNAAVEASGSVHDALASLLAEDPRPSCVVIDALLPAVQKAAAEVGLPTMVLHTESAASVRLARSNTMLHEKGPLSAKDDLGMATTAKSSGILINTFEALETADLQAIRDELAIDSIKVFATGPLHKLSSIGGATSSLLEQDRSCIEWLDTRAVGSVLYVGFGSFAALRGDDLNQVAWGLANSGRPFLWVVRPGLLLGSDEPELPEGFERAVGETGKVVRWAPQQEVLAHSAVGWFWTHSGWNSTLESIYEGVPMLSSPFFGDQLVNGRYVQDEWKIGFLLQGKLERGAIERAIARLREEEVGGEIRGRACDLKKKATMCLAEGGSTQRAVDELIDHLLSL